MMSLRRNLATVSGMIAIGIGIAATLGVATVRGQFPAPVAPAPTVPPAVLDALKPLALAAPAAANDELAKMRKERVRSAQTEANVMVEAFAAGTVRSVDHLLACITK